MSRFDFSIFTVFPQYDVAWLKIWRKWRKNDENCAVVVVVKVQKVRKFQKSVFTTVDEALGALWGKIVRERPC